MEIAYAEYRPQICSATISSMCAIIGKRVEQLREDMGFNNRTEFAEELHARGVEVGDSQLGHIERGRRLPSVPLLIALAQMFDTSADYLLGLSDNQLSAKDIEEELAAGGIGGRFEHIMARLSPARREQVIDYANYLAMVDHVSVERAQNRRHLRDALIELRQLVPVETINLFLTLLGRGDSSMASELRVLLNPEQERVDLFKD